MPQNKRESLIYTVMMCFIMVLWMSVYNVVCNTGLSAEAIKEAWLGFPLTYAVALFMDTFVVAKAAKGFAFRFLIKPESSNMKKILCVSCCMVIPMVILMSLYGGIKICAVSGQWSNLIFIWFTGIAKNFIMALPFQLIIAGPVVRKLFRTAFPEGTVLG